ncbi:MAG TPA: IucA/IucC family C-terminal-domain containing protein, partial [Bdellovibrionales bacterium]|nr:IucA/IucC family C-terminal-domain containing protein [Bdellovibrionales bacterium]
MESEQTRMVRDGGDPSKLPRDNSLQGRKYKPESRASFTVESYWVDASLMHEWRDSAFPPELEPEFTRVKNGARQLRLLVHPESHAFYKDVIAKAERAPDFIATATASGRTVLASPAGNPGLRFFVKLSLNKKLGGSLRTIKTSEVARSIGLSRVLAELNLPGFDYLPEVLGLSPKGIEGGGMIVRALPEKIVRGELLYIPLFALYGDGKGTLEPHLVRMIRESGDAPAEFIRTRILRPFAALWAELALRGITMEPHGQNMMIAIDRDGRLVSRFLFRDLGGFNVDFEHAAKHLSRLPILPTFTSVEGDYFVSKHKSYLQESLNLYFVGAFVYDLDKRIAKWERQGLIPAAPRAYDHLQNAFRLEVERVLTVRAGRPVRLADDYENIGDEIVKIRRDLKPAGACGRAAAG